MILCIKSLQRLAINSEKWYPDVLSYRMDTISELFITMESLTCLVCFILLSFGVLLSVVCFFTIDILLKMLYDFVFSMAFNVKLMLPPHLQHIERKPFFVICLDYYSLKSFHWICVPSIKSLKSRSFSNCSMEKGDISCYGTDTIGELFIVMESLTCLARFILWSLGVCMAFHV